MGRPGKLVKEVYEHWPVEAVESLPDGLKGVYVLYDPHGRPIRVGISGRGKDDVRKRLQWYTSRKEWRHAHSFSVFIFTTQAWFNQVEVLMLRAFGGALIGNANKGNFLTTTTVWGPPRSKYKPAKFVKRRVKLDGTIKVPAKHAGRRVRIEIGSHPEDEADR